MPREEPGGIPRDRATTTRSPGRITNPSGKRKSISPSIVYPPRSARGASRLRISMNSPAWASSPAPGGWKWISVIASHGAGAAGVAAARRTATAARSDTGFGGTGTARL
jgi:hypothetical protein